jgi:gas vesicle protein
MNIKTFLQVLLLFGILSLQSCSSTKPGQTAATVEDAEKMLAKQAKANAKQAKKDTKAAQKHFWSLQSKEAKKSIKKNKRRNKRLARARKRNS